jgi:Fe-S cluster biosynthesis and repair protein YggX
MSRIVHCLKTGLDSPGLDNPPFPGDTGQRIYEHISQQIWQEWLAYQTILINENQLSLIDPKSQALLQAEMAKFLFDEGHVTNELRGKPENDQP